MDLTISKSGTERIKAFKVGSTTVGCVLPTGDGETEVDARAQLKEILKQKRKLNTTPMDLMSAKQEAAKVSKKSKKQVYITVDKEAECHIVDKPDKSTLHVYKSGKEIPLPQPEPVSGTVEPVEKSTTKKEKVTNTKTKKEMATKAKKSAKKVSKKTAKKSSPKKAAKKATGKKSVGRVGGAPVKRERLLTTPEVKATSIPAGMKDILKKGHKRAKLIVSGKQYGVRVANAWAIVKSIMELSKDGMISYAPKHKGYYLYPKQAIKDNLSDILNSATYKNNGVYGQSKVPAWNDEFFHDLK